MLNPIVGFLSIIPVYIIFLIFIYKKKQPLYKHLLFFVFFSYLGVVISITLFPLPFDRNLIELNKTQNFLHNNYIPFKSIYLLFKTGDINIILRNILGNILLTLPFGFLIPFLSSKFKTLKIILLSSAILSILIESSQFIVSVFLGYTYKITDIDDIILNIIGSLIGYILYKLFCFIKSDS